MSWFSDILDATQKPREWAVEGLGDLTNVSGAKSFDDLLSGWTGWDKSNPLVQAAGFAGNIALDPLTYAMPFVFGKLAQGASKLNAARQASRTGSMVPGAAQGWGAVQGLKVPLSTGWDEATSALMSTDFAREAAANANTTLPKAIMEARRQFPMLKDVAEYGNRVARAKYRNLSENARAFVTPSGSMARVTGGRASIKENLYDVADTLTRDGYEGILKKFPWNGEAVGGVSFGAPARIAAHEGVHAANYMPGLTGMSPEISVIRKMSNHENPMVRLLGHAAEESLATRIEKAALPEAWRLQNITSSPAYAKGWSDIVVRDLAKQNPAHALRIGDATKAAQIASVETGDWAKTMGAGVRKYLEKSPTLSQVLKDGLNDASLSHLLELLLSRGAAGAVAAPLAYGMSKDY